MPSAVTRSVKFKQLPLYQNRDILGFVVDIEYTPNKT